jgi:hypothetical protein
MTEFQIEPPRQPTLTLPLFLLVAGMALGVDLLFGPIMELKALKISFPPILQEVALIAPALAAIFWFIARRKHHIFAAIGACSLWFLMVYGVIGYAELRIEREPLRRELTTDERQTIERLPFPTLEQASSGRGHAVLVEKRKEWVCQLSGELARLHVLRPAGQSPWP